jgi:glycine cleavage system H lipoate-binding protein
LVDGFEAPTVELTPGDRLCLPQHSWLVYQQDGTVRIGVEAGFLSQVGTVTALRVPEPDESVEQGHVGFWLTGANGEEHGVYMPLSGVVVEVNREATAAGLQSATWLVRLLPDNLDREWRSLAVPTR